MWYFFSTKQTTLKNIRIVFMQFLRCWYVALNFRCLFGKWTNYSNSSSILRRSFRKVISLDLVNFSTNLILKSCFRNDEQFDFKTNLHQIQWSGRMLVSKPKFCYIKSNATMHDVASVHCEFHHLLDNRWWQQCFWIAILCLVIN